MEIYKFIRYALSFKPGRPCEIALLKEQNSRLYKHEPNITPIVLYHSCLLFVIDFSKACDNGLRWDSTEIYVSSLNNRTQYNTIIINFSSSIIKK